MKISGDSLFLNEKSTDNLIVKQRYEIAEEEKRKEYFLLYIKRALPPVKSRMTLPAAKMCGLIVLQFSKGKEKLLVLKEDKLWYGSVEDCKRANSDSLFENKYFGTYYSEPVFTAFTRDKPLKDADKVTLQKLADDWKEEMKSNTGKIQNTQSADIYRTLFMQDNLTKVLVTHRLNPLVTITDFCNKLSENNIPVPVVSPLKNKQSNPLNSDSSHLKTPTLHG